MSLMSLKAPDFQTALFRRLFGVWQQIEAFPAVPLYVHAKKAVADESLFVYRTIVDASISCFPAFDQKYIEVCMSLP